VGRGKGMGEEEAEKEKEWVGRKGREQKGKEGKERGRAERKRKERKGEGRVPYLTHVKSSKCPLATLTYIHILSHVISVFCQASNGPTLSLLSLPAEYNNAGRFLSNESSQLSSLCATVSLYSIIWLSPERCEWSVPMHDEVYSAFSGLSCRQ